MSVQDTISGSFLLATMSLNNEYNALHGHGLENDFSSLEKKNKEKNKMKKMYYKKKKRFLEHQEPAEIQGKTPTYVMA